MQFTITSEYAKVRLDKFLKEHFPDLSRSYLQKLIEGGNVRVNGKAVAVHHFLKEEDAVEATIEPPQEIVMVPNPEVSFEVIYEEPDFVVVNKPAGLVVHQGEGHKAPDTLANGLIARYPEIGKVGDDPVRPGMAHRLDADVSGVMVIARTQDMFDHLKKQFKTHEVAKEYLAVVEGEVSPPDGTIEFALARKGVKMVARPKGAEGKRAITEYETIPWSSLRAQRSNLGDGIATLPPVARDDKYSLLRIVTHTGRTHQIRVHLKAKGWPIVGDRLYGVGASSQKLVARRLLLHARKLAFKDLQNELREFIIEPPSEFKTNP